jgi:hypothetical protein
VARESRSMPSGGEVQSACGTPAMGGPPPTSPRLSYWHCALAPKAHRKGLVSTSLSSALFTLRLDAEKPAGKLSVAVDAAATRTRFVATRCWGKPATRLHTLQGRGGTCSLRTARARAAADAQVQRQVSACRQCGLSGAFRQLQTTCFSPRRRRSRQRSEASGHAQHGRFKHVHPTGGIPKGLVCPPFAGFTVQHRLLESTLPTLACAKPVTQVHRRNLEG